MITKKMRQKLRSQKYPDMKPHIFDKLVQYLPHVMKGIKIPEHYGNTFCAGQNDNTLTQPQQRYNHENQL